MNPEHVADNVKDDEMVARASRLNLFDNHSYFNAVDRSVNFHSALRGVLSDESAKGGTKKIPLESIIGQGSVAHGDIAVVRQSDVSPGDWQLLTQRQ